MGQPSFTLVLHSHLPWVLHHGRWPHGVDWLNEAAAETYLPLWRLLEKRARSGQPLGVALGLTPVLCEQLAHPDFTKEFATYLETKLEAAREDRAALSRTGESEMAALAERWETFYRASLEDFLGPHGSNLVARFRRLEERGAIEIITCGATHGYLPLLSSDAAAEEQLRVAVATHRRHFGRAPRGVWLPECAYRPAGPWPSPVMERAGSLPRARRERAGIESLLARHGLEYFFVDTHLVSGGKPLGVYADRFEALRHLARETDASTAPAIARRPYVPYRVGDEARVCCFGRDPETALQVWSGEHGYPGDGVYLDFHKKRFPGGHRYWRVTHPKADLAEKQVYQPGAAEARAPEHARHFVELLVRTLSQDATRGAQPIACAMFDTELFGHWWFEGPQFLGAVIDAAAQAGVQPQLPSAYLRDHPADHVISLSEGSWGEGGGHQVWLNADTRWTWDHVHRSEERYERLVRDAVGRPADPLLDRLLAQAGRELLLLEASDWQFLITTVAARDYAEQRLSAHATDFDRLAVLAERRIQMGSLNQGDENFLSDCERRDSVFAEYDWRGHPAAGSPHAVPASG
ncbi:MAG TPA: 1,4-alpha-glucan branching protein domain-containing protein [Candidatus Eisenbacteria bacterium]|nr:1,4-alpha-glucan branching protein domain-containing protein [Candidatus Eisenbacteria bacterium]